MLKDNNNEDLKLKNIDEKYFYFFQYWEELTDRKTLDSYQFRLMNTLNILLEIIDVIKKYLNGNYQSTKNIEQCKKEACQLIKKDYILEKYYKGIKISLLQNLNTSLPSVNTPKELNAKLKAFIYHSEYAYELIKPNYLTYIVKELEQEIDNNNRKLINFYTNQLLSILIDRGWSVNALSQIIKFLYNSKEKHENWSIFSSHLLNEDEHLYKVFIPIKIENTTDQDLDDKINNLLNDKQLHTQILSGTDPCFDNNLFQHKINKKSRYCVIEINAFDDFSAANRGVKLYGNLLNTLSFYNIIRPWSITSLSIIVKNNNKEKIRQIKPYQLCLTYDYFDGSRNFYDISHDLILKDVPLKEKLLSTYSYTNIGKATYSQEEKFMNIWVALESLCKTDMYTNIIDNVLQNVPPAMCCRYIFSLIRNFSEDCTRCGIDYHFSNKSYDIKCKIKREIVENTIEIMNDNNLFNELLSKCQINDLLAERCIEIKELVTNPDNMIEKVKNHNLNVEEQLSRLYRIRNQIAHTAMDSKKSIVRYTEHLLDYLCTFVGEVLSYSKNKNTDSLPEILSMIKDNYNSFLEIADYKDKTIKENLLKDFFHSGAINLI